MRKVRAAATPTRDTWKVNPTMSFGFRRHFSRSAGRRGNARRYPRTKTRTISSALSVSFRNSTQASGALLWNSNRFVRAADKIYTKKIVNCRLCAKDTKLAIHPYDIFFRDCACMRIYPRIHKVIFSRQCGPMRFGQFFSTTIYIERDILLYLHDCFYCLVNMEHSIGYIFPSCILSFYMILSFLCHILFACRSKPTQRLSARRKLRKRRKEGDHKDRGTNIGAV